MNKAEFVSLIEKEFENKLSISIEPEEQEIESDYRDTTCIHVVVIRVGNVKYSVEEFGRLLYEISFDLVSERMIELQKKLNAQEIKLREQDKEIAKDMEERAKFCQEINKIKKEYDKKLINRIKLKNKNGKVVLLDQNNKELELVMVEEK